MDNFWLYNEFIQDFFVQKECFVEQKLSDLANKKIAFDVRWFMPYYIDSIFRNRESTMESFVEELLAKISKVGIKPVFIFGGMDVNLPENSVQSFERFVGSSRILRFKRFEAESLSESSKRREEVKKIKKLLKFSLQSNLFLIENYMSESLYKIFYRLDVDYLVAPQLRETQLLSLYNEGYIDGILGSPICLFLGDIANVISTIDFEKETFTFFTKEKILENFGFSDETYMRKIFLISVCLFKLDKSYQSSTNSLDDIEQLNLSDITHHQNSYEKNMQMKYEQMIEVLKVQLKKVDFNDFEAISERLQFHFVLKKETLIDLLIFFHNPVTYSLSKACVEFQPTDSRLVLDVVCDELIILFCLGIIDNKLLAMFSKNLNHQYSRDFEIAKCNAFFDINFGLILSALKASMKYCVQLTGIKDQNFSLQICSRSENFKVCSKPVDQIQSFACNCAHPTLSSVLKEFVLHHNSSERYIIIPDQAVLSQKGLLEHLFIKFLNNVGIISLEKKTVSSLGKILSKFENTSIFEKLIYFSMLTLAGATGYSLPSDVPTEESSTSILESPQLSDARSFNSWDIGIYSFQREFQNHHPNLKAEECFSALEEKEQINIRLACRLIELVEVRSVWPDQSDYDRTQFLRCFGAMKEGFNKTFEAELLGLLLHSSSPESFNQVGKLTGELPFQNAIFTSAGPLFSMWMAKFIIYQRIASKGCYQKEAYNFITIPYIRRYHSLSLDLVELIQRLKIWLESTAKFIDLCLSDLENPLCNHRDLMQQYQNAIAFFLEFYAVVSPTVDL